MIEILSPASCWCRPKEVVVMNQVTGFLPPTWEFWTGCASPSLVPAYSEPWWAFGGVNQQMRGSLFFSLFLPYLSSNPHKFHCVYSSCQTALSGGGNAVCFLSHTECVIVIVSSDFCGMHISLLNWGFPYTTPVTGLISEEKSAVSCLYAPNC